MPYLHVKIGKPMDAAQVDALRHELEQMISILPGKNADNCMIHIEPDCAMYMQGAKNPCVFAELRLYKASPDEKKLAFVQAFSELLRSSLGIPESFIYMNILEMDHWVMGSQII